MAIWQLRFEDQHRRIRYRSFRTKAEAETFAKAVDAAQSAGVDPSRRVRFDELVNEWRDSHLTHWLRASSVKDYKQSLSRMADYLGQRELHAIRGWRTGLNLI
jgi:hypothetical protein